MTKLVRWQYKTLNYNTCDLSGWENYAEYYYSVQTVLLITQSEFATLMYMHNIVTWMNRTKDRLIFTWFYPLQLSQCQPVIINLSTFGQVLSPVPHMDRWTKLLVPQTWKRNKQDIEPQMLNLWDWTNRQKYCIRKNIVHEMTSANKKHQTLNSKFIQGNCSFMEDRY
jgi:hypothetical protein